MIGDIVAKMIVEMKGDNKDLRAKIREVTGDEKKLAEQQLAQAAAREKQLNQWHAQLGKMSLAFGSFAAVAAVALDGIERSARRAQLVTAAHGVSIEGLRKASGGLRTEMHLLEQAAKLQHGAFKLTQQQMEMVQRAQRQLVREGNDQEEVTKKVTKAVVELEGGALQDFGIRVREGKTDAEKFAAVMESLAGKAGMVRDGQDTASEAVRKTGVAFQDSLDRMREAAGKLATAMTPLIEALARIATNIANIVDKAGSMGGGGGGQWSIGTGFLGGDMGKYMFGALGYSGPEAESTVFDQVTTGGSLSWMDAYRRKVRTGGEIEMPTDDLSGRSRKTGAAIRKTVADLIGAISVDELKSTASGAGLGDQPSALGDLSGFRTQLETISWTGGESWQDRLEGHRAFGKSFLEKTFGSTDEFSRYAQAFQMLQGASTAAFGSWVDGTKTASQAWSDFVGSMLKGIATYMFGEAIKYGAIAGAQLIPVPGLFNPAGAAKAGATAAAFAAGAIAVGGLARATGGGGGSGATSSAPGGGVGQYSGGGGQTGSHVVYVINDPWGDQTPRQRARSFKRQGETAEMSR